MTSGLPATAAALLKILEAAGSVCQNWDAVCSYHLPELNDILKTSLANGGSVTVPFSEPGVDPISGEKFTIAGRIELAPPVLSFAAGLNATCNAAMLIVGGSYTITPDGGHPGAPQPIAPTPPTSMVAEVYLIAVDGNGTPKQGGDGVVVFQGGTGNVTVVLHFNTSNSDDIKWSFDPPLTDVSVLDQYVLPAVQLYFQTDVKDLDYALTGVDPAPSGDTVQPNSFYIATFIAPDSDPADGVLSLFINATTTGPMPTIPPVVQQPLVSQDHTTSLIFSPNFIGRGYIVPGLTGFNVSPPTSAAVYVAASTTSVTIPAQQFGGDTNAGQDLVDIEPVKLSFSKYPYTIAFAPSTLKVSNTFTESQDYEALAWGGAKVGWEHDFYGTATCTVTLNKTFNLSDIVTLSDTTFSLSFAIATTDYSTVTDPGTSNSCWSGDNATTVEQAVQNSVNGVFPALTFDFQSLNFFRATNLLFPGKNFVQLDYTVGLNVPSDFVLLGTLARPT